MNIQELSLNRLIEKITVLFKRFPVTSIFVLIQAAFYILLIINGWDTFSERINIIIMSFLPTACLLTLSFHLFNEERKPSIVNYLIEFLILVGWGIYCYMLDLRNASPAEITLFIVCVIAIVLSVFTLSFIKRDNDLPFWHFAWQLFYAALISLPISGILYGGVALLSLSLEKLFGISVSEEVYSTEAVICFLLIAPTLFLLLIPEGEKKQNYTVPTLSKFYRGVVNNLFVPLMVCYLVTLYVYALTILIRWQLPNGWVSSLVTTLMASMLAIIFLLYPQQHQESLKPIERFALHKVPLLVIPLLFLMSIGIFRRISDYGITVSRLYLLVFNIWCYFVCIFLYIKRSRHLWWIPVSFAIVALLVSVGPWSITNLTKQQMRKEIKQALLASEYELPLSQATFDEWCQEQGENSKTVRDKLDYLKEYYSDSEFEDIIEKDVQINHYQSATSEEEYVDEDTIIRGLMIKYYNGIKIPEGYDNVRFVELGDTSDIFFENDSIYFSVENFHFQVGNQELTDLLNEEERPYSLKGKNGELLVFNYIKLNIRLEDLSFDGLIFTKD